MEGRELAEDVHFGQTLFVIFVDENRFGMWASVDAMCPDQLRTQR
jgi:hypothetical protein